MSRSDESLAFLDSAVRSMLGQLAVIADTVTSSSEKLELQLEGRLQGLEAASSVATPSARCVCPEHNQEMLLFCNDPGCNKLICTLCFTRNHKSHSVEEAVTEYSAARQQLSTMKSQADDLAEKLKESQTNSLTHVKRLQESGEHAIRSIETAAQQLHKAIHSRTSAMLAMVVDIVTRKQGDLNDQIRSVISSREQIEQSRIALQSVLSTASLTPSGPQDTDSFALLRQKGQLVTSFDAAQTDCKTATEKCARTQDEFSSTMGYELKVDVNCDGLLENIKHWGRVADPTAPPLPPPLPPLPSPPRSNPVLHSPTPPPITASPRVAFAPLSPQYVSNGKSLLVAARDGDIPQLQFLIERESQDPNQIDRTDPELRRPIHIAAWAGQLQAVKYLLSRGVSPASVDGTDGFGGTALHWAADGARGAVAQYLLDFHNQPTTDGTQPIPLCDMRDKRGATVLHWAAVSGAALLIRQLVRQFGLDPNDCKNDTHDTPLHCTTWKGHLEAARVLVEECQADINAKNAKGATPAEQAKENRFAKLASFLRKKAKNM